MLRVGLLLVLMTASAAAQEIVDKSGSDLPETGEFVARATKGLLDPGSAQIRSIARSAQNPDIICSLMNAKNAMGGYTGFHIAAIDMKTHQRFVYAELVKQYGEQWTDTVIVSKTGCERE
ncbi:hypothetical protein C8D77_11174 [Mesorhizobium loti]|uniref:Uncharacterized protein n=1 Tax=Rhizobium loti TaxID=381 RepID=A0A8E2W833_RHILI|nr:hypothetical protein [Mesorhizobium loti]PWJ88352.1 hypothetical protein C8D77_11174 [Mesorhizobium loti]